MRFDSNENVVNYKTFKKYFNYLWKYQIFKHVPIKFKNIFLKSKKNIFKFYYNSIFYKSKLKIDSNITLFINHNLSFINSLKINYNLYTIDFINFYKNNIFSKIFSNIFWKYIILNNYNNHFKSQLLFSNNVIGGLINIIKWK